MKVHGRTFLVGCDPELFVQDPNGRWVSAAPLFPGTKQEPYPLQYGAVQVDGMAVEFNIHPASTYYQWERNISTVLEQIKKMLPKGYTLHATPSVIFDEEVFEAASPIEKELGCDPDFDAVTGEPNPRPDGTTRMRTGAGHIHIGWRPGGPMGDIHINNCRALTCHLDNVLGTASIVLDPDTRRRELYGKASCYRPKPYGVEYRTLSNFWVMDHKLRKVIWELVKVSIKSGLTRQTYLNDIHYYYWYRGMRFFGVSKIINSYPGGYEQILMDFSERGRNLDVWNWDIWKASRRSFDKCGIAVSPNGVSL